MNREYHLKRKYGITNEQYDQLLREQEFRCGVCRRHYLEFKTKLCVDHDHSDGQVRGLLCHFCNRRVVGRLRRDTIQAVYDYLTNKATGWFVPSKKRKRKCKRRKKRGKV